VALEKVEGVFGLHPLFSAILVHGDSLQAHIILIGICDPVQASTLITKITGERIAAADIPKLRATVNDQRIRKEVIKDLKKLAKKAGLNG
jgi:long-chain acyl-CoA synthetase